MKIHKPIHNQNKLTLQPNHYYMPNILISNKLLNQIKRGNNNNHDL